MNELNKFNKYILEKCNNFKSTQDLASPLLVSSNDKYINGFEKKVLYIGQETNCWYNYNDKNLKPSVEELENAYLYFLKDRCAVDIDFWKFIRDCLNISREELVKNVIWTNTFICSKRTEIGHPIPTKELKDISIKYMTYLYNYFKPDYTILVNGPRNPYYELTIEFLKSIKSSLINYWPTKEKPLLIDESNNIFWTYHPNYQNRSGLKKQIIKEIKNKIN